MLLIKNALDFLEKCPENFSASFDWLHERWASLEDLNGAEESLLFYKIIWGGLITNKSCQAIS